MVFVSSLHCLFGRLVMVDNLVSKLFTGSINMERLSPTSQVRMLEQFTGFALRLLFFTLLKCAIAALFITTLLDCAMVRRGTAHNYFGGVALGMQFSVY